MILRIMLCTVGFVLCVVVLRFLCGIVLFVLWVWLSAIMFD